MGGLPGAVTVETGREADREPEIEASAATGRGWIHGGQQWLLASPQLLAVYLTGHRGRGPPPSDPGWEPRNLLTPPLM